jgi:hypothetical protein
MNPSRRRLMALAGLMAASPPLNALAQPAPPMADGRLVLSSFAEGGDLLAPNARWRGFSDRVMGGVSDGTFERTVVAGKPCIRMTGRVTRDRGGGFIQMALDLGTRNSDFDASAFAGIELLVHGNDESYNCHVRTADCGWYDQSYRASFRVAPQWQTIRLPWSAFTPNDLDVPLDPSRLQRVAVLGWMREFEADLALAEVALYA